METVIETIRAVRNVRADLSLPPTTAVELLVLGDGADRLAPHESYVRRLAGVAKVAYSSGGESPKGAATAVVGGLELAIPLRGLVDDPAAEIARNKKQLEKLEKELRARRVEAHQPAVSRARAERGHREGAREAT